MRGEFRESKTIFVTPEVQSTRYGGGNVESPEKIFKMTGLMRKIVLERRTLPKIARKREKQAKYECERASRAPRLLQIRV